jgi:hypothetical protein
MLDDLKWTTWHYIPEDITVHNHCSENLKPYIKNNELERMWKEAVRTLYEVESRHSLQVTA